MDVQEMNLAACLGWLAGDTGRMMLATLDSIAGAMPKPWCHTATIHIGNSNTVATAFNSGVHRKAEGPTELLARARLAVLCRMAMKEGE